MELIFIAIVLLTSVYAQFDVRPKNTYVVEGDTVLLQCSVTDVDDAFSGAQLWQEYYTDVSFGKSIATDANVFPDYDEEFVIVSNTKYDLEVIGSQLKHGGKYGCQNVFESHQTTFAEIIVLDSDPVCTSTGPSPQGIVLENDFVTYSCKIRYQGRWGPIQVWTDRNGNDMAINVGDDNVEGSVVHTYLSFTAQILDDGQKFKCETRFGQLIPPPGANEDTTIPSYDNTTPFQTLIVHYPPRDTQITDMNGDPVSQLYPGEQIKCISTSNPAINYVLWQDSMDGSILADNNTDVIVIQEAWLGNFGIRCVVRNTMGPDGNIRTGEHSTVITISVVTTTTTTTPVPTTFRRTISDLTSTITPCTCSLSITESERTNMTAIVVGASLSIMMAVMGLLFAAFIFIVHRPLVEVHGKCGMQVGLHVVDLNQDIHVEINDTAPYEDTESPLPADIDSGYLNPVSIPTRADHITDTEYEAVGGAYEHIQQSRPDNVYGNHYMELQAK